ncbi:MAG: erythromycin esterase family protein [Planctomycetota bacterium]
MCARLLTLLLLVLCVPSICEGQQRVEFTSDLKTFADLSALKTVLKDVDVVALGENTHGLGEVFRAKAQLVEFLHRELGFDLVLFESGFGDAALAWTDRDSLSSDELTRSFTSNFYYHCEEIRDLVEYVTSTNGTLRIGGIDCQPQQDYFSRRLTKLIEPVDPVFAKSVVSGLRDFNKLYQLERDEQTDAFRKQRDQFIAFLSACEDRLEKLKGREVGDAPSEAEVAGCVETIRLFKTTYARVEPGQLMGWPASVNLRDKAMFERVLDFRKRFPDSKIIIWAQNSHVENQAKPGYSVTWMGHHLKRHFGEKYYSIGAVVYRGESLGYSDTLEFEHNDEEYLAFHLHRLKRSSFVLDLRARQTRVGKTAALGMETGGNTAKFVPQDRFDGLLFLEYSGVPKRLGRATTPE